MATGGALVVLSLWRPTSGNYNPASRNYEPASVTLAVLHRKRGLVSVKYVLLKNFEGTFKIRGNFVYKANVIISGHIN